MIVNKIIKMKKREFLTLQHEYINHLKQYHVHYLNGDIIHCEQDYLSYFKDIYNFPDYYGNNVNAFIDCMRDLDSRNEQGFVLVIYNFSSFLKNHPRDKRIFIKALEAVAYYLEKECLMTSGGRNNLKSFDVYLIKHDLGYTEIGNKDMEY